MDNIQLKSLYKIGAFAALLQLASILALSVVMAALGPKPASAQEYFLLYQTNLLAGILRGDFLLLFLIGAYLGTFPALFAALRRINPVAVAFATLFTLIAVVLIFSSESTFSWLYLGKQYAAAISEVQRAQLLAAGEAMIASDMWHSTAAYMSGILLQGSGVIISLVMLRSKKFSKVTAITGLLGNLLDLFQHVLNPFSPEISQIIKMGMGPFYILWFPMLARDLLRLAKNEEDQHA